MKPEPSALRQLCKLHGIILEHTGRDGSLHSVQPTTQRALLAAMGLPIDEGTDVEQLLHQVQTCLWQRPLAPTQVVQKTDAAPSITLNLPVDDDNKTCEWILHLENGSRQHGRFQVNELELLETFSDGEKKIIRYAFTLPAQLPSGYHRFELRTATLARASTQLIVAPKQAYRPSVLTGEHRVWGPELSLHAIRSHHNWGIGDLSNLKALIEGCAQHGAAVLSIAPLHAQFPRHPAHINPAAPSSRLFLNILYLDIEAISEFAECPEAQETVNDPQFQARLRALRASEAVDYAAIAELKLSILDHLYRYFRKRHSHATSVRRRAFQSFLAEGGEPLRQQALFDTLHEHFQAQDPQHWAWSHWPAVYRDPHSPEVAEFTHAHTEQIEFYSYLYWQLALQASALGRHSLEQASGIGLCHDLSAAPHSYGAETWAQPQAYAHSIRLGIPPGSTRLQHDTDTIAPFNPIALQETGYQPFIQLIRHNMRHFGALRLYPEPGFFRQFWVPEGADPDDGAFVEQPAAALLGILALESQRNQCLVIADDTAETPAFQDLLVDYGIFCQRQLYTEKTPEGSFIPPTDFPREALVTVTTPNAPTITDYWHGHDLDLHHSPDTWERQIVNRAEERARLLVALDRERLLPEDHNVQSALSLPMTTDLLRAIYTYLARTPSRLLTLSLSDVFVQAASDQSSNLPSNADHYWRCKLPPSIEDWPTDPRVLALITELHREREKPSQASEQTETTPHAARQWPIPDATYRFQFHSGFTFGNATALIPYLSALGISHCYASPYLRARPGSTHGYDIIDHCALNPEIGGNKEFEQFTKALHRHQLGQILDIVPNHMGVMGSDNTWWLDVLENGQAAAHADFFDIDWQSAQPALRYKVLVPVLGNHYGLVLENGELRLVFNAEAGSFHIQYYEHSFPIDPHKYPQILGHRIHQLETRLGSDNPLFLEYQSLLTALGHLPACTETEEAKRAERQRDKEIHKRNLADLCYRSPDIAWFIEENRQLLNGTPGETNSFDQLHELLEAQPYQLSFWRVASDNINYRRFFDVNDLAGLRMENEAVFQETHALVFKLLREGKLDGLRIDHPDGLFNPKDYFEQLQKTLAPSVEHAEHDDTDKNTKPLYVVVEKILESYEWLPEDWPVHGTTGYDFTNLVNALFIDPQAEEAMTQCYEDFIGGTVDLEETLYLCKKLMMRVALGSELAVLTNQIERISQLERRTRDFTSIGLWNALREVVACFPVYRTYITADGVSEKDRRYIDWAVSVAKRRSQALDVSIFDFVRTVLLLEVAEGKPDAFREQVLAFVMKFQQYTGPLMAKGLEDTVFYRYNRLLSLNEVGGDPGRFSISVSGFHHANQDRMELWPHAMLSSSTHDSKRSEDVRARINVLSELPEEWDKNLKRWSRINKNKKRLVNDQLAPSANDEYMIYQNLLGAYPLGTVDADGLAAFRERIQQYLLKAVKEAKEHSSWINPNQDYEEAVTSFAAALLEPEKNRFLDEFLPFQHMVARFGLYNSLSQTLLKLTAPGLPDIYQGNEIWDFSLVDPDNRRPVDYPYRQKMLHNLRIHFNEDKKDITSKIPELLDNMNDGRMKLYLTWRTLNLRRQHSALFQHGAYIPLTVKGDKADHACAFARRWKNREVIVIAPRLFLRLLEGHTDQQPLGEAVWGDTTLEWIVENDSAQHYKNVLTQETVSPEITEGVAQLALAKILQHFPAGLLVAVN
ncbi:MAG: 4-alpha-glucanotransferase [Candidatus Contendobacter odensis]|uniref:4-alpha-glucanotransferase n=1 Tax=Candidatus Contendibacter odensensis TaxID=1400860 RepID=A0A2G6PFU3_9GAMM|nr:MAG: 4-alpha-glucanotransferase [Candidatus Contendobacter odensis]